MEVVGLVVMLIGGGFGESNVLVMLRGEKYVGVIFVKLVMFGN